MANEPPFYALVDDAWHEVGDHEQTVCGLALPYPDAIWQTDVPDEVHCGEHAPKKAKAKK